MFQIPKEMKDRYASILLPSLPTQELKITSITEDEVVGIFADGEEVHINHKKILTWWPNVKIETRKAKAMKAMRQRKAKDSMKELETHESNEEQTDGQETKEN